MIEVKYCFGDVEVLHYLFASFSNERLRRNFKLLEEDHIFVSKESEHSSPGLWSKMGLDGRHQDSTVVHLYVLTVHRDRDWEPYTTLWSSIRTRGTLYEIQLSIGHVPCLVTSAGRVRSNSF